MTALYAENILFNIVLLAAAFTVLFKAADYFVESAVGIAHRFNLPKMLVGIVIVGFATTAPEIAVSAQSAFLGHPEIAFGNAVGSVITDDGVALALAGILAPTAIAVNRNILRTAGLFLIAIDLLAFLLVLDFQYSRLEGLLFILLLAAYIIFVIYMEKKRRVSLVELDETAMQHHSGWNMRRLVLMFAGGLAGVVLASRIVIHSSVVLAQHYGVSETIIGLTIIAIGTSLPEISTCIIAARKGHGEIAVGDIVGADILNILWIIGVSSVIRPIVLQPATVYYSFTALFIMVGTMLVLLRRGYTFTRGKGIILLLLYAGYLYMNYRLSFLVH